MASKWYFPKLFIKLANRYFAFKYKKGTKAREELAHWVGQALKKEANDHFGFFYTTEFGLTKDYFNGKCLLDVGCGPSGSLEWADGAEERIGLDPLANEYLALGAITHKMRYISAPAEKMPFKDGHFDAVFSFNALDHVDSLDQTVIEIWRVLKWGGEFFLITDMNHSPTTTEPTCIPIDFAERMERQFTLLEKSYFSHSMLRIYDSLKFCRVKLDQPPANTSCILKARFRKL